jgi:hypothetical protein
VRRMNRDTLSHEYIVSIATPSVKPFSEPSREPVATGNRDVRNVAKQRAHTPRQYDGAFL